MIAGLVYLLANLLGGRLYRRLLPDRGQLGPAHLAGEVRSHVSRHGAAAGAGSGRYNALQKLAYLAVVLVLAPLMLLSGLTMSPGVTTAYPELFTLFGGRQSARTIHFLVACLLVLFLLVHIWQVLANRPLSLMRAMITGRAGPRPEPR